MSHKDGAYWWHTFEATNCISLLSINHNLTSCTGVAKSFKIQRWWWMLLSCLYHDVYHMWSRKRWIFRSVVSHLVVKRLMDFIPIVVSVLPCYPVLMFSTTSHVLNPTSTEVPTTSVGVLTISAGLPNAGLPATCTSAGLPTPYSQLQTLVSQLQ